MTFLAPKFVAYPEAAPPLYNGSGTPCDMWIGPCCCGATHTGNDDPFFKNLTSEERRAIASAFFAADGKESVVVGKHIIRRPKKLDEYGAEFPVHLAKGLASHKERIEAEEEDWVQFCKSLGRYCTQCGFTWRKRACGPTHAAVYAARIS